MSDGKSSWVFYVSSGTGEASGKVLLIGPKQ